MPNKYSDEFKADAVSLYERHPELSYRQAAEGLGIGDATLKVWVRQARKEAGKVPTQAPEAAGQAPETAEEELARLRVENESLRSDKRAMRADLDRVTEERAILQKATKYFPEQRRPGDPLPVRCRPPRHPRGEADVPGASDPAFQLL